MSRDVWVMSFSLRLFFAIANWKCFNVILDNKTAHHTCFFFQFDTIQTFNWKFPGLTLVEVFTCFLLFLTSASKIYYPQQLHSSQIKKRFGVSVYFLKCICIRLLQYYITSNNIKAIWGFWKKTQTFLVIYVAHKKSCERKVLQHATVP